MDSFVYRWTNKTLNKIYIGFHKGTEDDGYICSSASKKFWEDFNNPAYVWQREILYKGIMKECQEVERKLLDELDVTSEDVYNQRNNLMFNLDDEVRNKLSESAKKRNQNPAYIEKLRQASKKQWENPAHRARITKTHTGKQLSDLTKEKIREARANQIITTESRKKAADAIKSKPNVICPHCGASGRYLNSMKKKHFENCKGKL
jgi:predicted transcriptional regulator